jgi:hypothetical protein
MASAMLTKMIHCCNIDGQDVIPIRNGLLSQLYVEKLIRNNLLHQQHLSKTSRRGLGSQTADEICQ